MNRLVLLLIAFLVVGGGVLLLFVMGNKNSGKKDDMGLMASSASMNCGAAYACGVLTLERGGGSGNYNHQVNGKPVPQVHGLWPQVGKYGNSKCFTTANKTPPANLASCYSDLSFEQHEWTAHSCGGKTNASDFFNQVCNLARGPLEVMTTVVSDVDNSLSAMASALCAAGYDVYNPDAGNDQLEIAVYAGQDGQWKFAAKGQYGSSC